MVSWRGSPFRIGSEKMGRSSRRHRDYRASTMLQSRDYAEAEVFVRIRFFRWISRGAMVRPPLRKGGVHVQGSRMGSKGEPGVIVQGWTIFACYASTPNLQSLFRFCSTLLPFWFIARFKRNRVAFRTVSLNRYIRGAGKGMERFKSVRISNLKMSFNRVRNWKN